MEKTAVEFLKKHIENDAIALYDGFMTFTEFMDNLDGYYNKAKQMEKQQIIEAHGDKQKTKSNPESIVTYGYTYTGEMYYNEKFK